MVLVQNTEINAGRGEGVSDLSKRLTWQRQLVATLYLHQVEAQSLHSLMRLFASETQSETQLAVVLVQAFLQPCGWKCLPEKLREVIKRC